MRSERRSLDAGASSAGDRSWQAVLARYDLDDVSQLGAGGGTAAPKVVVSTPSGRYLLRRRRPEMSNPEIVAFDHGVIAAAGDAGLPVARPVQTRENSTWVGFGGCAYEMFPFVEQMERFAPGDRAQIAAAARSLAHFHWATASLDPPAAKRWPREHLIGAMAETLEAALTQVSPAEPRLTEASRMLESARQLQEALTPAVVAALPHTVTHGDYTPANVQFRGGAVAGIFDFDWVSRQARLLDVGEALQFFCFPRRSELNPDSIWSLVEAWQPDMEAAALFLSAYQSRSPLSAAEAMALPLFMRETWLGVRIRAMRKVAPEERLRILTEGAIEPLEWLEASVQAITELVGDTRG